MMQYAKLVSPAALAVAKQEVEDAVRELESRPENEQSVYTNLTLIYNAIADHPQASMIVDSTLADQKSVQLLRELLRLHRREEEVQWALGRIISLSSQASIRFQCKAGQLEMWNDLFTMRSTHPESIRVQEASLRAGETLFMSNEFHITKLQPLLYLEELIGVMDRFVRIQTPRKRAHGLVVLALRVLVALYSSSQSAALILFDGERSAEGVKWACAISKRMLDSFAIFAKGIEAIQSWLTMTLLLLRQHPAQALDILFSPNQNVNTVWWLILVVEQWKSQTNVMSSLLATLTHIFALPHNILGDELQLAVAARLISEQGLLHVVCDVIDYYCNKTFPLLENPDFNIMLEAIRIIRQWSERPALTAHFESSREVKNMLLPILMELLNRHVNQSPPSAISPKALVILLEILLILRHLAASQIIRSALIGYDTLQTNIKLLRCRSTSRPLSSSSSTGMATRVTGLFDTVGLQSDSELDALVAREARNLHKLITNSTDSGLKSAAMPRRENARKNAAAIVVSRAVEDPRRQPRLRAKHVRPETLQAYIRGNR
ncbi:unnamed protein product [Phytophthora fragariaefolia]|uniref:Unnamed protein product n=1 Tax=Phytophthora fragariaefolia TaxID=1490495 RepID=A0A9W6XLP3_9STRA|nr:unnamed protein product [Phytophthora fragariaefolia]